MPKHSKRYEQASARVEAVRRYGSREAIDLVKELANAKFDESVDIAVRLGVDPKKADQMIRGASSLPHGTGKTVRILVFAQGDAARAAQEAGADFVGADELIQKVQDENWLDYDKVIATRDMMGKVGRLGRVLGPRNLMPNPKVGTVVGPEQVADTVRELKQGKVSFRVEKHGAMIHTTIGRASMPAEHLHANLATLMATLLRMKPSTAKGTYIRSVSVSSTMGPGVKVDPAEAQRVAEGL
jgi:large subunit ribosomal protein L1